MGKGRQLQFQPGEGLLPMECVHGGDGCSGSQQGPDPNACASSGCAQVHSGDTCHTFSPNRMIFHEISVLPAGVPGERGCTGIESTIPCQKQCQTVMILVNPFQLRIFYHTLHGVIFSFLKSYPEPKC